MVIDLDNSLFKILAAQKSGRALGIYSACSANPFVLEAVLRRGKRDDSIVLIESTANQCDQFGGYTGMTPRDFRNKVYEIADKVGFDHKKLYLGGDHLGPLTFTDRNEEEAMNLAEELVRVYVEAGFTKIHLDTSMRVSSDDMNVPLSNETIAKRGARLARAAEDSYRKLLDKDPDAVHPVYIVGSEVPIPGGSTDNNDKLAVTKVEDFNATVKTFEKIFKEEGLEEAFSNVIAFVVQPGVEEKDSGCVEYDRAKATELMAEIKKYPNIVFEGHSTDYQTRFKLREMVEDGVGILKVGPGLTFALREGLYALSFIEDELIEEDKRSHFREVLDEAMLENPKYWQKHYHGTDEEITFKRRYSFSDRCRYYYANEKVEKSIEKLFNNLRGNIPWNLLSQFMPVQYDRVREGSLENDPEALVIDRIGDTIDQYMFATRQQEL